MIDNSRLRLILRYIGSMKVLRLHLLNADGHLTSNLAVIESAVRRAEDIARNTLNLNAVDIVCSDDPASAIPETGMSGFAAAPQLINLFIDASRKLDENELYYTICHELMHIKRYEGPGFGSTLLDAMIFEGLGVAFEKEVSSDGSFLSRYIDSKQDNRALVRRVTPHFDDTYFDRLHWFIAESAELPRWTGYRVGYWIVREYCRSKHKKASSIALEDFDSFRVFLREDLGRA